MGVSAVLRVGCHFGTVVGIDKAADFVADTAVDEWDAVYRDVWLRRNPAR